MTDHTMRAATLAPPVRVQRAPRRARGRPSIHGVRVECRNRILFRREVRPGPEPRSIDPSEEIALLPSPSNRTFRFSQEVDVGDDGAASIKLSLDDSRYEHVRRVLKLTPGDSLRVGVVNGSPATATVASMDDASMTLTWRVGVETSDGDTARRSLSNDDASSHTHVDIDLLLAMPRPKVMTRLWAPLASMGVRNVYLTNAARVEKYYWDSKALTPRTVTDELTRGMEQSGDTRMPGVCVVRRFPAAVDAVREMVGRGGGERKEGGGALREGSAAWLVEPPSCIDGDDGIDVDTVMLMAHPGADATIGDAFALAKSSGGTKDGSRTRAVLAVGPEGGWTEYERHSMSERGFTEVALGNRTFATDVACLALVAAVRERTGSW